MVRVHGVVTDAATGAPVADAEVWEDTPAATIEEEASEWNSSGPMLITIKEKPGHHLDPVKDFDKLLPKVFESMKQRSDGLRPPIRQTMDEDSATKVDMNALMQITDEDGAFQIDMNALGSGSLACTAPGYVRLSREIPGLAELKQLEPSSSKEPAAEVQLDFPLQAAARISGRVLERATGQGVPGVTVKTVDAEMRVSESTEPPLEYSCKTAEDGSYTIDGLPAGPHRIGVDVGNAGYAFDMHDAATVTVALGGTAENVNFKVTRTGEGSGSPVQPEMPVLDTVRTLFNKVDRLGRDQVEHATYVQLKIVCSSPLRLSPALPDHAWLIAEDDRSVTVMQDDLIPWTYSKDAITTIPNTWGPVSATLGSVKAADFAYACQEYMKREEDQRLKLYQPGPSQRFLVAHDAWKKGLTEYVEPILAADPKYSEGFQKYSAAVLEDLAWQHFLRAVNLLKFADREEVLPHLRLVLELSPEGEYGTQAKDLLERLEVLVADEKRAVAQPPIDEASLSEADKTAFYISELKDVCCEQTGQPGFVILYEGTLGGHPSSALPTSKLEELGMRAGPALIAALSDDTPTRTVYHWRDFARSRQVWRVSDFAYALLRDTTKQEFSYQRMVGFTFSYFKPEEKAYVIEQMKQWYAVNGGLSTDEWMLASFSSNEPGNWVTAGRYFLEKKDTRAVAPLLEKLPQAGPVTKAELCELLGKFGDPAAIPVLKQVMESDTDIRMNAAIGLWDLGDASGVPVAIECAKSLPRPPPEDAVWFLMRTRRKEAIDALTSIVTQAPPPQAYAIIECMMDSFTGLLFGEKREPAACVEVSPVLIAAMGRSDYVEGTPDGSKTRVKDLAAKAFVILKNGMEGATFARMAVVNPLDFSEKEPDPAKRDSQISALREWYNRNQNNLVWDSERHRLEVRDSTGR
jgi:hypothetical protein